MELIIAGATSYIGERFISNYHSKYKILALGRNKKELSKLFSKFEVECMTYESFFNDDSVFINDKTLLNFAFPRNSDTQNLIEAFDFTENLYTNSVKSGVNKIINISSQSIYEYKRLSPAKESDLPKPFSLYGIAKYYSESYLQEFSNKYNIDYINIRLGSVVGPGFEQRFINKLINRYINNEKIEIMENDYQHSFIYIDDLIKNLDLLLSSDIKWNDTYNMGSDYYYTITDVMCTIEDVTNVNRSNEVHYFKSNIKKGYTNRISNERIKDHIKVYNDSNLKQIITRLYCDKIKSTEI